MKGTKKDIAVILCCLFAPILIGGIVVLSVRIYAEIEAARLRQRLPSPEEDYPAVQELLERRTFPTLNKALRASDEALMIGNPIYSYDFLTDGFQRDRYVYPLFCEGELLAAVCSIGDPSFMTETYLISFLPSQISRKIAFVHDINGWYAYDGTDFHLLIEFDYPDRDVYASIEDAENLSALAADLVLNEVVPVAPLEYEP